MAGLEGEFLTWSLVMLIKMMAPVLMIILIAHLVGLFQEQKEKKIKLRPQI